LVVVAMLVFSVPAEARSQETFRAWLGLYEPAHLGWLENENRIGELCTDPATLTECYAEHLGSKVSVHELYRQPDESSERIGELIVVAVPGRGLSAHFRPARARHSIPFTPDLFLQDWGYGPYFHQTLSEQRGNWFQLPPDPWEGHVWLRRELERGMSPVIAVRSGDIIELGGSGWYVVAAEPDALLLRAEQPGDLWCEEGDPPPLTPAEPTRSSRAELVDPRGHLMFRLKYLKGC
jgi:hypothetical protein